MAINPYKVDFENHVHMDVGPHRLSETFKLPEYSTVQDDTGWLDYVEKGGFSQHCLDLNLVCTESEPRAARQWDVQAHQDQEILLPIFHFPGWTISLNGKEAAYTLDETTGLVRMQVHAGSNRIEARWSSLRSEQIGLVLFAIGGLLIALMIGAKSLRSRSQRPSRLAKRSSV